jgi:type VI secretion system protein ImpF
MAETPPLERLQPALLDRLRDDDPLTTTEPRERRFMSKRELRAAVLRDLTWLFNATRLQDTVDLSDAPLVGKSVVNFGLPAMSGRPASSFDVAELERSIRQAIIDYEPRILPNTLRVTAMLREHGLELGGAVPGDHNNVIGVEIVGHLWSQPVPFELLLRTEIDLEAGTVQIRDSVDASPATAT